MRSRPPRSRAFVMVPLLLSAASVMPASAQTSAAPATSRFLVTVVRLRPELADQWLAVQREEVIPAQKQAGVASRVTLATSLGNAFEYAIILPFPSFAAMDGDAPLVRALGREGAARVNAKLRAAVHEQHSFLTNRQEALQVAPGDAPIWRTSVRRVLPGQLSTYLAYLASDVLPGMKKAKSEGRIAGYGVATRGVGATSGELTTITYYAKFADMDAGDPLVGALGRDEANRINAKGTSLATTVTTVVRRRIADLSF